MTEAGYIAIFTPILIALIKLIADGITARREQRAERDENRKATELIQKLIRDLTADVEKLDKAYKDTRETYVAIIRDRLTQAHAYHMAVGYIEMHSKDSMSGLYDIYKKYVPNNTFVVGLMDHINRLPIRRIDEEA